MSQTHSNLHETITPPQDLPPQAAIPGTARHEPVDETASEVDAVNSVQHAIRAAVANEGLGAAPPTVEQFGSYEREHLLPDLDAFRAELSDADQYMVDVFEEKFAQLERELDNRKGWYEKLVTGQWGHSIDDIVTRATDLRAAGSCLEVVTVAPAPDARRHPDASARLPPSNLETPLDAFGFEPPHTFLAVYNAQKDSQYPLIPWYGTIVCTCPFKQQNPHMPCCKHELFAAAVDHQQYGANAGANLPQPYAQIVSPLGCRLYTDIFD